MIERNDPMLEVANDIIEQFQLAMKNVKTFREKPEYNLHLLHHKQVRSYRQMSKRRRKIFLSSLTHFDPVTRSIGTTRFGQQNGWRFIPPIHICKDKVGEPLTAMMKQWSELLNYE